MTTVRQTNNANTEKAKKTLLITYKCVAIAFVLNYFFMLRLTLFLNYEQK